MWLLILKNRWPPLFQTFCDIGIARRMAISIPSLSPSRIEANCGGSAQKERTMCGIREMEARLML